MTWEVRIGDCRQLMAEMPDCSVDSIVCDPPYELGFMGKSWDASGIAYDINVWKQALRVLKPGGHLLAFSGSRTYHRMVVAIEDAGFEIRDQIMWVYGSGFPKSHDVSKGIDKAAGVERAKVRVDANDVRNPKASGGGRDGTEGATRPWIEEAMARGYHEKDGDEPATPEARQWQGWGTALKPAHEPICVARKSLIGTVAANVLAHGTGALNIDGCRVGEEEMPVFERTGGATDHVAWEMGTAKLIGMETRGRWPANLIHDGDDEVVSLFPNDEISGSAARFFYCAKAGGDDRSDGLDDFDAKASAASEFRPNHAEKAAEGEDGNPYGRWQPRKNIHPTVKPTDLMRYLCRLVTPPNGLVLDPFAGSGSTGRGAVLEKFNFIGCELSDEYAEIAKARITNAARISLLPPGTKIKKIIPNPDVMEIF